jgi:hypothetical protein
MTTTTTTDGRYRIVGDITIKGGKPTTPYGRTKGKKVDLSYGSNKQTNFDYVSIIQSLQPLTPESPYFLVDVRKCGKKKNTFRYFYFKNIF